MIVAEGRQRSEQEREAARLERERKRAGRPRATPPEPAEPPAPPRRSAPPEPQRRSEPPEPQRRSAASGEPPAPRRRSAAPKLPRRLARLRPSVAREPVATPAPPPPGEPGVRSAPVATAAPPARLEPPELAPPPAPEPLELAGNHLDVPSGVRRVSRIDRVRAARKAPRKMPRPSRQRAPSRRRHSRVGRLFSLLALLLAGAVIWFLVEMFQPGHGSGHGSVAVTIPPHSSSSQVGDLLERDGVIASSFFFKLRATLGGQRSSLRSGLYHLKLDMSYGDVLSTLTTAPPAAPVTELTITEGRTRRQVSALLHSQGVPGRYFGQTHRSPLLDPRRYGAPAGTDSLEGFLFPSTYQLRQPVSVGALIADQLSTFRQRFAKVDLAYARSQHLSAYDVLIVASMVQAEAGTASDRPRVASVIYNRLRDGMALQIDATTRYVTDNYTSPLTESQLSSPSPYNTRLHKGLTPTPIDSPGMASIQAAAHPARTNYLYFVVKPCGNGQQTFTSSFSQFQADSQRYQSARTKRGGRSPASC
ncbi:MAG: endolytic transglycosylase MltG [Solirubrobacteraceae bacterium]